MEHWIRVDLRETNWKALLRRPDWTRLSWFRQNIQGVGYGALAGVLALTLLSLSGSEGLFQRIAADPVQRVAWTLRGGLSYGGLARISNGMSRYALAAAERAGRGTQQWEEPGLEGWRRNYDFSRTPALLRRNLTFEEAKAFNALVATSSTPLQAMKAFVLNSIDKADYNSALLCLTQAVYYEAGFESGEGQQAVAQVILNRLRHPAYPKSVCGVVYQGSQRVTGCQFSFTCDGSLTRPAAAAPWSRARDVAQKALGGFVFGGVGTATHYHADYVFPYWAVTLVKLKQIGAHIFYRMTGPAGSERAFDGAYAGGEAALSASVLTGGDTRTPDAPSVIAPPVPLFAPPRMVTLTIGGETRTYAVSSTAAAVFAPQPGAPGQPVVPGQTAATGQVEGTGINAPASAMAPAFSGTLAPLRRLPTAQEVQDINARLREFEEKQARAAAPPSASPKASTLTPGE